MAAPWTAHRHLIVLFIAMVVGAYQMLRLEQRRTQRDLRVDEQFDLAVKVLRSHLAQQYHGEYHILFAKRPSTAVGAVDLTALVVNRSPAVPRIEAELVIDRVKVSQPAKSQQASSTSRRAAAHKQKRGAKPPPANPAKGGGGPRLQFRVYDTDAMAEAAAALEQRDLARTVASKRHDPPFSADES